jgi:hypothetical protein
MLTNGKNGRNWIYVFYICLLAGLGFYWQSMVLVILATIGTLAMASARFER